VGELALFGMSFVSLVVCASAKFLISAQNEIVFELAETKSARHSIAHSEQDDEEWVVRGEWERVDCPALGLCVCARVCPLSIVMIKNHTVATRLFFAPIKKSCTERAVEQPCAPTQAEHAMQNDSIG
jgi:hypothetical protein